MLTPYGRREWLTILLIGGVLIATALLLKWWIIALLLLALTLALLSFFRDPQRTIPIDRGVMVAPADGRVSSVHRLEHFEPFGEPAVCIRIFLSVFNVHVNRSPCHGQVASITHKPGKYLNALKAQSAQVNEANMMVLINAAHKKPVAAVNQIAGAIARRIVCAVPVGAMLQRGQRYGMIKFGSTTELYIPESLKPQTLVQIGQKVRGGETILARVATSFENGDAAG